MVAPKPVSLAWGPFTYLGPRQTESPLSGAPLITTARKGDFINYSMALRVSLYEVFVTSALFSFAKTSYMAIPTFIGKGKCHPTIHPEVRHRNTRK